MTVIRVLDDFFIDLNLVRALFENNANNANFWFWKILLLILINWKW